MNYLDVNCSLAPTELFISTIQGGFENEFSLVINSNTGKEEVDFEYQIRCLDEEIQQKIKSIIDKWIRENKPPQILQWWSNVLVYFIYFIGFLAILISGTSLTETVSKNGSYKTQLKKEAKAIIEKGISQANMDSSLLLLLKLQADYVPDTIKTETIEIPNITAQKVFVFSSILFVIALVRPRTIIGIAKNYDRGRLYNIWIKIIYGTISALILAFVSDSFFHFIYW